MRIDVISLFPEFVDACAGFGVVGRARERGLLSMHGWNPRDYAEGNYRRVDDRPFGGGPGMVMLVDPLRAAIAAARDADPQPAHVVYMSPQGRLLDQARVRELAALPRMILLCGRYEGVDERLIAAEVDEELSIGDYVLSGGELPAAVLVHVPSLQFDPALVGLAATPWLLTLATVLLVWPLARLLRFRRDETAVVLLCVALCNSSFIGYPMIGALLGEDAVAYAVVYDQFGTFVLLSTFGLYVLARYSGDTPPTMREIGLRIVRFPPLWALAVGLTVMPEQPPTWIAGGLQKLADALLPLVMLAVGLSIRLRLPRDELRPLAAGLVIKLVLMPACALLLSLAFRMPPPMFQTNVIESAMPSMITAAALAISHGLAPRLVAALVGYGIVLSLATLPAWAWLLERLAG